jgi:Fe-S oxidoreductase
MLEEFIVQEMNAGRLTPDLFTEETRQIRLHGHCFQKALVGVSASLTALSLPVNYQVSTIPSGCCGMAGSFGYEREHYQLSMDIAELVLLPAVRNAVDEVVAAPGTSCRHQIHDGTGKRARHPAEILFEALK